MRDYYDIYAILEAGYDISKGIESALKYSRHKLSTKSVAMLLLSRKFVADENFRQLDPVYQVSQEEMRNAIFLSLQKAHLV